MIDTCRARQMSFDQKHGISRLVDPFISKANAKQRRGRAGRVRPGICFHLLPTKVFEKLAEYQVPDSMRLSLEELCLSMKSILGPESRLEDSIMALLLDPPPQRNVSQAITLLGDVEALDHEERITPLGEILGRLPVNVRIGRLLIMGCLGERISFE